jgi:hypothetical protein
MTSSPHIARSLLLPALSIALAHGQPLEAQRLQATTRSNTTALTAVSAAFRTALANPTVRTAAKTEIQRQLRTNRPLALISGSWVTAIDIGRVYGLASVRPTLTATLGASGPTLVNAAIVDPGRIVLAFTPAQLGALMMADMVKDITATVGVSALKAHMTDMMLIDILIGVGIGAVGIALFMEVWHHHSGDDAAPAPTNPPNDPLGNTDGDPYLNWEDPDDDNDSYADEHDQYPNDKDRHICDCSGRGGIYFSSAITDALANALHTTYGSAVAGSRAGLSLGAVQTGQTAAIRVVFP